MKCNHKWLYLIFGNKICKRCPMNLMLFMPDPDPNKKELIQEFKCIAKWLPVLLTETTGAINNLTKFFIEKGKTQK